MIEEPEAFRRFQEALKAVLTVPKNALRLARLAELPQQRTPETLRNK